MRISVSDKGLAAILKRFKAKPDAQVEFVISPDGLDIIANAEGYLTLARWCLVMAHPEMGGHAHPRWLYTLRHLDDAVGPAAGLKLSRREVSVDPELTAHDVRFYRTDLGSRA
ncbi:MAG: hypothetical protein U1E29_02410 [Coriobacteriia bacterium]|nr:hypothetical protein [Coriobacteriia bacterium]